MNPGFRILPVFFALCMGVFLCASQTHAAEPIAKISSFKGEVLIQSDMRVSRVTKIGLNLNDGDRVQTKQGEAQITFNDGAVMKVRPFTNTMIQEREEKGGWWIFGTKIAVRRITCFIGKLWFKTGVSKRRSYLQTPTAVCGVRGSVVEVGFDNVVSLLNVIEGLVDKLGPWEEGPFANPGSLKAFKNRVYQAVAKAFSDMEKAKATGDPVDLAKAEVAALRVVIAAAEVLKTNPDPGVVQEAEEAADEARRLVIEILKEVPEAVPREEVPITTTTTSTTTTTTPTTTTTTTTMEMSPAY